MFRLPIGIFVDMGVNGARRRTLQRLAASTGSGGGAGGMGVGVGGTRGPLQLQTSASLPETPVFARGCDLPRTPPRSSALPPRTNTLNSMHSIGDALYTVRYSRVEHERNTVY